MGYQLYCEFAPELTRGVVVIAPLETEVNDIASPPLIVPVPLRSAVCWKYRIAFLWSVRKLLPVAPIVLVACAAAEPGAMGTCNPRAKPSCSHSLVTPTHAPLDEFRTSTSSQPLMMGHSALVVLCVAVVPPGTQGGQTKLVSPFVHGLPTEPPPAVPQALSPK